MAKIVLDKKGVRELLRSQEMMDICLEHAEATKTAAGSEGYEISSHVGTNRVNASVRADTIETIKDNIKIIQCNSNFLKKQGEIETSGQGITGRVLNDGTITLNGTTTGATYIQLTDELKITNYDNSQNFEKNVLPVRKL